ncbi:TonB-dependent receptor [Asticcacaulis sp. BYS171W]|uniref:TonB-dependent receptor n=1 Tax=Asticcacaulis aquaticus TaxID=2984212 RepID=A0ABT5HPX8_9CAUL|nr:TonB-dependent receptor [Asticcacaulis aquaticus]MDC7682122.1 TonB-dependent receptor [Asticcacaulis aquaticus]
MRRGLNTPVLLGVVATAMCLAPVASAQSQAFDIPSDLASKTLPEFGRQSGLQIIAPTGRIKGIKTRSVSGRFLPREALARMIEGTGLEIASDRGSVIALRLRSVPSDPQRLPPPPQVDAAQPSSLDQPIPEVIIVGVRRAQQSAIERRRMSATLAESIVAEDVGSFPDRNLNEAISRIAGVALARNDMGEGADISLRGNGPDLTRVEIDGMGVAASGFDLAVNGGGRAADLRELPADIIKSVDVIKGQTADMTEGGLGGTVVITTRTAFEFPRPYLSMRVSLDRNSLSQRWSPDTNFVATRTFLDGRLGVLFNLTQTRRLNDSHQVAQAGVNNSQGYVRLFDLDDSPEKTYALNPALVSGVDRNNVAFNAPLQTFALASGTGTFSTNSALDIVRLSSQAQSKAECLSAFPLYSETDLNRIQPGTNNANRAALQEQRIREQVTCLNQWNDYLPNTVNERFKSNYEDRTAWDIRLDYRVNAQLTVFAKYQYAGREMDEQVRTRGLGSVLWSYTDARYVSQSLSNNTAIPIGSLNTLSPVAGSGYSLFNTGQPTGSIRLDSTLGGGNVLNAFPIYGVALNVVPGSLRIDSNHYATSLEITNPALAYDNIQNDQKWKSSYLQVGGAYKNGSLSADFQASHTQAAYQRTDARFRRSILYSQATLRATEQGLWRVTFPAGFDPDQIESAYPLNPATNADAAQFTNPVQVTYDPKLSENAEDAAKVDLTYRRPDASVLSRIKVGVSYRNLQTDYWSGGGYALGNGVTVPASTMRGTIRACENTPTTALANRCAYGYAPISNGALYGVETVTREQLLDVYRNSVQMNSNGFLPGIDGYADARLWNTVDVQRAFALMVGTQHFNLDCMKWCRGSDGIIYSTPISSANEQVYAAYYMVNFDRTLPLGMRLDGNFGVRYIRTDLRTSGFVTFNAITKNADWNANEGADRVTTSVTARPVSLGAISSDWLPSYNLALWFVPGKIVARYNWAIAVARPPISRLWPSGNCTFDERVVISGDTAPYLACGTVGNPDLKPYRASRVNTSLEWYINRDSYFTVTYYRQKVKIGAPILVRVPGGPLFENSSDADPNTGRILSDYAVDYSTYVNGPAYTYAGWEIAAKAAWTRLPGPLRHTGTDFNISTNRAQGAASLIDPVTGEKVGVPGRSDYFLNIGLWYDDGKTIARLTYQARDAMLRCLTGCGTNTELAYNFPSSNPASTSFVGLPYNPSEPYYSRAYAYLDAKVSHEIAPGFEIYWEGRNLLKEASVVDGSRGFADSNYPFSYNYGGRRFTVGVVYKLH